MRNLVVGLAIAIASGCSGEDGSTPPGDAADTGSSSSTGGELLPNPDGTTEDTSAETDSVDDTTGGFSVSDDSNDSDDSSDSGRPPAQLSESFEDALVGEPPGAPWLDVASRIDGPTVPSPTAMVIDTEDAQGVPTRALQLYDAIGTSQGILAPIDPGTRHRVSANVRVEQFSDATGNTWPIAVGLSEQAHDADLHSGPRALVYAHPDGRWHMSVHDGLAAKTGVDRVLSTSLIELDRWYRVLLEVDRDTGSFRAEISDPVTEEQLAQEVVLVFDWSPDDGDYDTIAFFDGEYDVVGGTIGGQASVDDIEYAPVYWGG